MTKVEEKKRIKEDVSKYLDIKGLSQNELSQKTGISGATISSILTEKWDNISDEMWLRLRSFLPQTDNTYTLVTIHNRETIINCVQRSRMHKSMICVLGYTGSTKTTTLRSIEATSPNTYYFRCEKSMNCKQFITGLLKSIGINYEGNLHAMLHKAIDELNSKRDCLLIIDEAGKLDQKKLMYLHDLRDLTRLNCGIILAGVEYFQSNLKKWRDRQKEGMQEFYRRINEWVELERPTKQEIKYIANANGIEDNNILKALYQINDFGTLQNEILSLKGHQHDN